LIEPDFLPVSVAEPPEIRAFWDGWLAWSRQQGIDYFIGRRLPATLAELGLDGIAATAETALYNGGTEWAPYWQLTIIELRDRLVGEGKLDNQLVDAFLARSARLGADPSLRPGWRRVAASWRRRRTASRCRSRDRP
jgi:hypothetical protein